MRRALFVVVPVVAAVLSAAIFVLHKPGEPTIVAYLPGGAKKVWEEAIPIFEREHHVKVVAVFGSCGKLLYQAYLAKEGDVISLTNPFMKKAEEYGIVEKPEYVACFLPAIIMRKDEHLNIRSLKDLAKANVRIVMCNLKSCTLGKYFYYVLKKEGLWDEIENKVATFVANFPQMMSVLLIGDADVALGWNVGAYWYPGKFVAVPVLAKGPFEPCLQVAVLKFSKHKKLAEEFVRFLLSPTVWKLFKKYGYLKHEELVKLFSSG